MYAWFACWFVAFSVGAPSHARAENVVRLVVDREQVQIYPHGTFRNNQQYEIRATARTARLDLDDTYLLVDLDRQRIWWVSPADATYVSLDLDFALEELATTAEQRQNLAHVKNWFDIANVSPSVAELIEGPCRKPVATSFKTRNGGGQVEVCATTLDAPWVDTYRTVLDAHTRLRTAERAWFGLVLDQPGFIESIAYRGSTDSSTLMITEQIRRARDESVPADYFRVPEDYEEKALDVGQLFGFVGPGTAPPSVSVDP